MRLASLFGAVAAAALSGLAVAGFAATETSASPAPRVSSQPKLSLDDQRAVDENNLISVTPYPKILHPLNTIRMPDVLDDKQRISDINYIGLDGQLVRTVKLSYMGNTRLIEQAVFIDPTGRKGLNNIDQVKVGLVKIEYSLWYKRPKLYHITRLDGKEMVIRIIYNIYGSVKRIEIEHLWDGKTTVVKPDSTQHGYFDASNGGSIGMGSAALAA
ncbi:hypothetical protein THASP1DRAFT_31541 [Thamnocephalis sphaerospora]|uniref:Uncharacterized protein n=1 Tax=Thamnocephalis sphaerospora TaxID=78915 RepID=A0A4P9XMX4_9FUNG|nr:hypothetical protein THASP1DRAFT_31541 [Thamnocephalis sphaerospora]|eukprot:RKP06650.1 hypothetical protein THASP1DRAFT_31541 [Thamnocephalis sphaerospora]